MGDEKITAEANHQKPKNLIRSQYKDIMVKVDDDIYYLDRLQLALKSGYFEKLFIEDYRDRNSDLIELPLMDTDTFSAVIDIIYGKELESVINSDNFVPLLMAMDYLQMDIDSETCKSFLTEELRGGKPLNNNVFKLYNVIAHDAKYKYLLPVVYRHLSQHLEKLQDRDELLSIEYCDFFGIISCREPFCNAVTDVGGPFRTVCEICARWICHDVKNRSHHALNIVNAARCRFYLSYTNSCDGFNALFHASDEHTDQASISRYFYKLLMCCGEVLCSKLATSETTESEKRINEDKDDLRNYIPDFRNYIPDFRANAVRFSFSREPKLKMFLENRHFYDITVKVDEKMYQLHRSVLKSQSSYFKEIFSKESSEIAAQFEAIPPTAPNKDKIYPLDGIDAATFDLLVDHMYLGKIEPECDVIFRLFKAAHMLKMGSLKNPCCDWMKTHSEGICGEDVVEILNFTHEHTEYEDLNRFFLSKYIVNSWPKIDNLQQFADLFKDISVSDGANLCENGVYLFDKVDQETFKFIIDRIYNDNAAYPRQTVFFDKKKLGTDNVVRILKASCIFKMKKLTEDCVGFLIQWRTMMSPTDVREVVSFTLENTASYEVLNTLYLVQHMMRWPQVDVELFCTISYNCLENMLMSYNLCFDDPRVLLDICSKWVMHDVENRYHLIPRIALAISRNHKVDCNDNLITNLNECSLDFVKDKLWEILSSTSVLPFAIGAKKQTIECPIFITSKMGRSFSVLNADGNEIISFRLCENVPDATSDYLYIERYSMSATTINDNLFILCCMCESSFFHVYNFSLGKLYSLAADARIFEKDERYLGSVSLKFTLLNCCNEIYCCREDGQMLKYSFEFNRWSQQSAPEPNSYGMSFASDGHKLYRMFELMARTDDEINYTLQVYDFQINLWVSMPNLPNLTYTSSNKKIIEHELVFLNEYGLAALFKRCIFVLDQEARVWREIRSLPYHYESNVAQHEIITQNESDEMLYVSINKLYQYSSTDRSWQLKNEWPLVKTESILNVKQLPYGNIIGVHNPKIRTQGFNEL